VRCELDLSGLGYGQALGSCDYDNELSGSLKGKELVGWLIEYHLLKKDCFLVLGYFFNMPLIMLHTFQEEDNYIIIVCFRYIS
jgi:hypothetical protein